MANNNTEDLATQATLLNEIKKAAETNSHPSSLRTLAEAYALVTGRVATIQNMSTTG